MAVFFDLLSASGLFSVTSFASNKKRRTFTYLRRLSDSEFIHLTTLYIKGRSAPGPAIHPNDTTPSPAQR